MYSLSSVRDCFIKSNQIKLRMDAVIKEYLQFEGSRFCQRIKEII